ncbi:hypothetical protein GCM10010343_11820 [Streptomyces avidinii]|uniref:ATP dependent DNA ligase-like protein n=1 Tax=Streptomyces avidinii TaxID=1895 RepID=A0ABS4KXG0_STRAV|nr:hypothetical protein [Streptomyces avidinii]GGY88307.1 hypothetical protein GCM10010343_11820 [Streptomyces avidinii]
MAPGRHPSPRRSRPAHFAFDLLQQDGQALLTHPYGERRGLLERLFSEYALTAPWTLCPMATDLAKAREWLESWTGVSGVEGLRAVGRTVPLRPDAARRVAEHFTAAAPGHPCTGAEFSATWGSRDVLDTTLVHPALVAEVSADRATDRGGVYRHPLRFQRLRLDVTVGAGGWSSEGVSEPKDAGQDPVGSVQRNARRAGKRHSSRYANGTPATGGTSGAVGLTRPAVRARGIPVTTRTPRSLSGRPRNLGAYSSSMCLTTVSGPGDMRVSCPSSKRTR